MGRGKGFRCHPNLSNLMSLIIFFLFHIYSGTICLEKEGIKTKNPLTPFAFERIDSQ